MHALVVLAGIVGLSLTLEYIETRRVVREGAYQHNLGKYMRAFNERRQHENEWGEDNAATHFRLQELLRIEAGALHFLRTYHPHESGHLEIRLRALLRRLDDTVIH